MELTLAMRGQAAKSCERPGEDQRSRAIEYAKCATSRGSYSRNLTPGSFLLCKAARVSHQLTVRVLGQAISRAKSKNASDSGNLTPGPFPEKEGVFEDDYQKKTLFSAGRTRDFPQAAMLMRDIEEDVRTAGRGPGSRPAVRQPRQ